MFFIFEIKIMSYLDFLQILDSSGTLLSGDQLKEKFEQEGCDYVFPLNFIPDNVVGEGFDDVTIAA